MGELQNIFGNICYIAPIQIRSDHKISLSCGVFFCLLAILHEQKKKFARFRFAQYLREHGIYFRVEICGYILVNGR